MRGLNHPTQDSTGSNGFEFPNPSSPNAGPSSPTPFPNQNPKPSEPETAEPQASAANSTPEAGSRKPVAGPAPSLLQPQKTDEPVRSVRLESANGATESCCHGQSESASAARGNAPSNLQAPKAAAELGPPQPPVQSSQILDEPKGSPFSTPEDGSQKPEAALTQNPDNPDKLNPSPTADNYMKNQQDHPTKTVPRSTPEFFRNPDIHPQMATVPNPHAQAAPASAPKASAANSTPEAGIQASASESPEGVRAPASTSAPLGQRQQQPHPAVERAAFAAKSLLGVEICRLRQAPAG